MRRFCSRPSRRRGELVLHADEHARAVEQRLLDEFTQAEQEQLKDLLTRARELLRTQPKRPPTP